MHRPESVHTGDSGGLPQAAPATAHRRFPESVDNPRFLRLRALIAHSLDPQPPRREARDTRAWEATSKPARTYTGGRAAVRRGASGEPQRRGQRCVDSVGSSARLEGTRRDGRAGRFTPSCARLTISAAYEAGRLSWPDPPGARRSRWYGLKAGAGPRTYVRGRAGLARAGSRPRPARPLRAGFYARYRAQRPPGFVSGRPRPSQRSGSADSAGARRQGSEWQRHGCVRTRKLAGSRPRRKRRTPKISRRLARRPPTRGVSRLRAGRLRVEGVVR